MIKFILSFVFLVSCLNASDDYVRLSSLNNDVLKDNGFVALDSLDESDGWVSLDSLEQKHQNILEDDTMVVIDLSTQEDEYIALSVYDEQTTFDKEVQEEYVALDDAQTAQEYDIVAIYEQMLKEEEEQFLSMNFDF